MYNLDCEGGDCPLGIEYCDSCIQNAVENRIDRIRMDSDDEEILS